MIEKLLAFLENGEKCLVCGLRKRDIKLRKDGVGICEECYNELYMKKACDYYDTNGIVDRLFAPFEYRGGIRRALMDMKFNGFSAYGYPIGAFVCECLPEYYEYNSYDIIIPVPLHAERMRERGYNQVSLIAKAISDSLDVELAEDVLFRIKNTKRQMNLSDSERQVNLMNAFYAVEEYVYGKRILLSDDIYTTGATLKNCVSELKAKGAREVSAIVVCENFKRDDGHIYNIHFPINK